MEFATDLHIEPLTDRNLSEVYYFCERNVEHFSQPERFFAYATLGDSEFNPVLTLVARREDNREVAAFFMGTTRRSPIGNKTKAVLKFCVVDAPLRRMGLGTYMLKMLYGRFKSIGFKGKIEAFASPPDYWFPGVYTGFTAAFFWLRKNGFRRKRLPFMRVRYNLTVNLDGGIAGTYDLSKEPPDVHNGFKLMRAEGEYGKLCVNFVKKHFSGTWAEEASLALRNSPPTAFVAVNENNEVVGFACHSVQFDGSFGPTGVRRDLRGRGIGGTLLKWCLYDLKKTGHKTCEILWVTLPTARYYSKTVNASITKIFWPMYSKIK